LFISGLSGHRAHGPFKSRALLGEIVAPGFPDDDLPPFDIFFAGRNVRSDRNGLYYIPLSDQDFGKGRLRKLSIMICKRFEPKYQGGGTIKRLCVSKPEKAKWFDLQRERDEKTKRWKWVISPQELLKEKDNKIPKNCIIICLSSKYLARVEDPKQDAQQEIILPRVVLVKNPDAIRRQSAKSALESVGTRNAHEKPAVQTQRHGSVEISITY